MIQPIGSQGLPKTPEEAQKRRELDAEYDKRGANFGEQRKSVMDSLGFAPFKLPNEKEVGEQSGHEKSEKGDPSEVALEGYGVFPSLGLDSNQGIALENNINLEFQTIEAGDSPQIAVLNRLLKAEKISQVCYNKILESRLEEGTIDLSKAEITPENELLISGYFMKIPENIEDGGMANLENFFKDNPDIKLGITNGDISYFQEQLYTKIGKNYIQIDTGNQELDKAANFDMALEMAAAEILRDYVNIPTSSDTFKQAIRFINGDNRENKLDGINTLYALANANASKSFVSSDKMRGSINLAIETKKQRLAIRYAEIIELIGASKEGSDESGKLKLELAEIKDVANEIEGGDIFAGFEKIEVAESSGPGTTETA